MVSYKKKHVLARKMCSFRVALGPLVLSCHKSLKSSRCSPRINPPLEASTMEPQGVLPPFETLNIVTYFGLPVSSNFVDRYIICDKVVTISKLKNLAFFYNIIFNSRIPNIQFFLRCNSQTPNVNFFCKFSDIKY